MGRETYRSDLNDAEWDVIKGYVPEPLAGGRPATYSRREIVNAILYVLRTGCGWAYLPHDFPKWKTVYDYFRQWRKAGVWQRANDALRGRVRQQAQREVSPSTAVIDSQSVKTTEEGGVKGFDAGKKVKGRKRHIVVDTLGLVLTVLVHAANLQDYHAARQVFARLAMAGLTRLTKIWADAIYKGDKDLAAWVKQQFGWDLEVVVRPGGSKGFQPLPHRWVVERTLAWLGRNRRLSKDYERCPETSETWIYLAMTRLMARRLALSP
jgi:putative transposase